jgi:hypothetical protein
MSDFRSDVPIGVRLRIKYQLGQMPTDAEIKAWFETTQKLIAEGETSERAGDLAAKYKLPGYRTGLLKAEADNIEALLRVLAKK